MRLLSSLLFLAVALPTASWGAAFSDDFDGPGLGASWRVASGAFTASGGRLEENSGDRHVDAQLLWEGGLTTTPDQFAKLQVVQKASHSWGFLFRSGDPSGHHYEVHLPLGGTRWRWELLDPDFVDRVDDCRADEAIQNGDWLGATVVGTGTGAVVSVWRWDLDPDLGGSPDPDANWGPPDCTMSADPSVPSDGLELGIRSYTGNSTAPSQADHWAAGDLPGGDCGNGVTESGEQCDDGGETATCNADCTFVACGDGTFNASAEECELDAHCSGADVCSASCLCEAPPICGNGTQETGEDCDDFVETASCDADCTFPMCGDGELNASAGEACEANADCAAGELCQGCSCVVANGQLFGDEFGGGSLSSSWVVEEGDFSVSGGVLHEDSGDRFLDARLRWSHPTDTPDQFGKLRLIQTGSHTWGFVFRAEDTTDHHYEVHMPAGGAEWRWELYDPHFVERVSQCAGDVPSGDGDWIGAAISGSGASTMVSVWRWDDDPDAGGAASPDANWGSPDCVMIAQPSVDVSDGRGTGIRTYTGSSSQSSSVDSWTAGDLVGSECGNAVIELGEECDDGGESPGCNADCTIAVCGDGVYNASAEACESDAECGAGDICSLECECIVEPVCGNGIPEPGEECDTGFPKASCDADCTFPMCGDGELNPAAGEACEVDADCAAGERCSACSCVVSNGQLFSDDFGGGSLDPSWTVMQGSFATSAGRLVESSGSRFTGNQLRWDGGLTDTPAQFAKLQLVDAGVRSWGFMLRNGDGSGHHYEVHMAAGSLEWRWELYDPGYVDRVSSCLGDQVSAPFDWIGVAIEGAGASTKVSVWRWGSNPDAGDPDPAANWGAPDCQMQGDPSVAVDDGRGMGVRSYTSNSSASSSVDNWSGGDLLAPIDPPRSSGIVRILSSAGVGVPGSMLDPDGIVVDSADNVYVAACGLGPASEGVFKVTPGGLVSQVLDATGDGVSPAHCPVGLAVDSADNVYVATFISDNVFKITPAGAVSEVLDASGGGVAPLAAPLGVAVDANDTLFVTGHFSDNVFALPAAGGVQVILDASGGGTGTPLEGPFGVATDAAGNAFVAGFGASSDSVFKVTPGGATSVVLGPAGAGAGSPLEAPHGVALDAAGNLYVTGNMSDNVFRVTPGGDVSVIADSSGDGAGNALDNPTSIAVDAGGTVYVAAFGSDNAFEILAGGTPVEIIDATGDGSTPYGQVSDFAIALDALGNVYTAGIHGDAVFKVTPP